MPFTSTIDVPDAAAAAARPAIRNSELMSFVQIIAFGVIGLVIIILTARSIYANLNKPPATITMAAAPDMLASGGSALVGSASGVSGGGGLGGSAEPAGAMLADESTIAVGNVQVKASSIRKVTQLVENHPNETLGIIRGWMASDHA